jgi:hypothetical protein
MSGAGFSRVRHREGDMHTKQGVGILAGLCGLLVGALSMYLVQDRTASSPTGAEHGELVVLQDRMDRTDALLHEIKRQIDNIEVAQYHALSSIGDAQSVTSSAEEAMAGSQDTGAAAGPDMAVEEAIVGNIITRLYDPAYTRSTTLAEVMGSEEMVNLSDASREKVVSEMVGMLNRGEIDVQTFFSGSMGD